MVLPVNGTREALFAFVQAVVDAQGRRARADAESVLSNLRRRRAAGRRRAVLPRHDAANGYLPDLDAVPDGVWRRCQVLFLCNPGNPAGATRSHGVSEHALELAEKHDFVIAADECYAEIYLDERRAAAQPAAGVPRDGSRPTSQRCVVFHSLSKRSSVPGLRSGFVAGDPALIVSLPALSHLSRQRHAGADAARERRRVERRRARCGRTASSIRRSSRACCRSSRLCST